MLTEELNKKIWLGVIIVIVVLAALWGIWAFFINRGTLTVTAKAPYNLEIQFQKNISCATDTCSATIAPGDYKIIVTKIGYKDQTFEVSIPVAGEKKQQVNFEFLPTISEISPEQTAKIFADIKLNQQLLDLFPTGDISYDPAGVVYLAINPKTNQQTLYLHRINKDQIDAAVPLATFQRELKKYTLFPDLEKQQKVAIIDNSENSSTLYMVDAAQKSRINLLTYPSITDFKWLPGDKFLFEAREEKDLTASIFIYDLAQNKVQKTDLKTSLADVVTVDDQNIIAATSQFIAPNNQLDFLEGQLIGLGQNNIQGPNEDQSPATSFVQLSLINLQSRLIKAVQFDLPSKLKLGDDGKIYFLIADKGFALEYKEPSQ